MAREEHDDERSCDPTDGPADSDLSPISKDVGLTGSERDGGAADREPAHGPLTVRRVDALSGDESVEQRDGLERDVRGLARRTARGRGAERNDWGLLRVRGRAAR